MDPEKKSLNFIFTTKYVIPKSLSRLATSQVRGRIFCIFHHLLGWPNQLGKGRAWSKFGPPKIHLLKSWELIEYFFLEVQTLEGMIWVKVSSVFFNSFSFTHMSYFESNLPIPNKKNTTNLIDLLGYKAGKNIFNPNGGLKWWFQPIWKICSSNWIISPDRGKHKKHFWNHHRLKWWWMPR